MAEYILNIEKLKDKKILLATPMYGGMCFGEFANSLISVCKIFEKNNISWETFFIMGESLIPRARNFICDFFMNGDYDYLIFLDSDIKFVPTDILTLIYFAIERDDMKIITGAYPKKEINWNSVVDAVNTNIIKSPNDLSEYTSSYFINPLKNETELKISEPQKILYGGTGFMLIKREVFEEVKKNHPERLYKNDANISSNEIMAYFDCIIDPKSRRYLSEDYMFCQMAKDLGIDTWVIPWINLTHIGTYSYVGNMEKLGQLQQKLTIKTLNKKKKKK